MESLRFETDNMFLQRKTAAKKQLNKKKSKAITITTK